MSERPNNKEEGIEYKKKLVLVQKMIEGGLIRIVRDERKSGANSDEIQKILEKRLDSEELKFKGRFPDKTEEITDVFNDIKSHRTNNEDEYFSFVVNIFSKFLADNFLLEELEKMFREDFNEEKGFKTLNRLFVYDVYEDSVNLHIPPTFLENPAEFRSLFFDAMKKLAKDLQTAPELKDIKKIAGSSWVVYKMPKMIDKMGFEIVSINEDTESAQAEISREKLIELYGN